MLALLIRILLALRSVEGHTSREAKIHDLPEQLLVFSRRSRKPVRLRNVDRLVLVYLYRPFPSLLDAIIVVKPETLLRWHRRGFRAYWHWKSWHRGGSWPEERNNTEGRNRTRSRSNFFIAVSLGLQSTTAIFRSIAQVGDRCGTPAKLWMDSVWQIGCAEGLQLEIEIPLEMETGNFKMLSGNSGSLFR